MPASGISPALDPQERGDKVLIQADADFLQFPRLCSNDVRNAVAGNEGLAPATFASTCDGLQLQLLRGLVQIRRQTYRVPRLAKSSEVIVRAQAATRSLMGGPLMLDERRDGDVIERGLDDRLRDRAPRRNSPVRENCRLAARGRVR